MADSGEETSSENQSQAVYSIENARHLNNIRYAELMKDESLKTNIILFDEKELRPSAYEITDSFAWGYPVGEQSELTSGEQSALASEEQSWSSSSILYQKCVFRNGSPVLEE